MGDFLPQAKSHRSGFGIYEIHPKDSAKKRHLPGIGLTFEGYPHASMFFRKPTAHDIARYQNNEQKIDESEYIVYAMVESGAIYEWVLRETVSDPIEALQRYLVEFYKMGFNLDDITKHSDGTPFKQ